MSAGPRVRWLAIWALVAVWFAGLAFAWFGDWLHLALAAAIALVMYELLAGERTPDVPGHGRRR